MLKCHKNLYNKDIFILKKYCNKNLLSEHISIKYYNNKTISGKDSNWKIGPLLFFYYNYFWILRNCQSWECHEKKNLDLHLILARYK